MWLLRKEDKVYYLQNNVERHIVGRQLSSNLILSNDTSISRQHAVLKSVDDGIEVVDCKARYGTFISSNGEKYEQVVPKTPTVVKFSSRIKFGILDKNEWSVDKLEMNCVISLVDLTAKKELEMQINSYGWKILPAWTEDCNILVMPKASLTSKFLMALLSCKPIVKPEYFKSVFESIKNNTSIPNWEDYRPEMGVLEHLPNHKKYYLFNIKRQSIFENKVFYIFSPGCMKVFENIIKMGGGKAICLENNDNVRFADIIKKDSILIGFDSGFTQAPYSQNIIKIEDYYKKKRGRLIPVSEIALAIVHCSLAEYCNPNFDFASKLESQPPNIGVRLAPNSDQLKPNTEGTSAAVLPITMSESQLPFSPVEANLSKNPSIKSVGFIVDLENEIIDSEQSSIFESVARDINLEKRDNNTKNNGKTAYDTRVDLDCESTLFSDVEISPVKRKRDPSDTGNSQWKRTKLRSQANTSSYAASGSDTTTNELFNFDNRNTDNRSTQYSRTNKSRISDVSSLSLTKRQHVEIESDDSNDDVPSKVTKTIGRGNQKLETLFAFEEDKTPTKNKRNKRQKQSRENIPEKQQPVELPKSQTISMVMDSRLEVKKLDVSIYNWQCKSNIKKEESIDLNDESKSWIREIIDGFAIKIDEMRITVTDRSQICTNNENNTTNIRKGRKTFQKKQNYVPQSKIFEIHPVCI